MVRRMAGAPTIDAARDRRARRGQRATALGLALAVLLGAGLVAGSLDRGHDWGGDFAGYLLQSRALLAGRVDAELAANRFALAHSVQVFGPVAYPWGFPVLLAPALAASGLEPLALKLVGALAWVGVLLLLAWGFTRAHPGAWRLALVAGFAVDPALFPFTNEILSDLPFLLLATAAVLWMDRVAGGRRPWRDGAILGGLMAAAFFVRTNGLLLLPTLAVAQVVVAWRRRPGEAPAPATGWRARLLPYVVFALLVAAWRLVLPEGGSSHLAFLGRLSQATLRANLDYYRRLPAQLLPGVPHPQAAWEATVPLAILGAVRRGRAALHQVAWILGTLALYVAWPAEQGLRFLFPVLPFYASFVISGLAWLAGGVGARARTLRTAACVAPVLVGVALLGHRAVDRVRANLAADRTVSTGPFSPPARALFDFLSTRTPADATVILFKPRVLRLMTGRRAFTANRLTSPPAATILCLAVAASPSVEPPPAQVRAWVASGRARRIFGNGRFTCYHLVPATPP